jgi:hypothetical protein
VKRPSLVHAFVFVGAVLLFSLEPLVGRLLLPRFGGAFHVWTTALMFFQGALFVAYLYAHLAAERLGRWHLLVVAVPLALMPPTVGEGPAAEASAGSILLLLSTHIALPFVALATTAVVAQRWWARSGREPYGLYAVSNLGSLGALALYALVVEPLVGLHTQRWAWLGGYLVYLVLAILAWRRHGARPSSEPLAKLPPAAPPPRSALVYWALLSAAPSAFLMAVTNLIALDVGSVPLVWVVPLAIYLASFVVAFARPEEGEASGTRVPGAVRRLWPHIAAVGLFFFSGGDAGGGWIDVLVHLAVLAFVTLAAHGELYRARPAPQHLTLFYLVIALGGWIGGAVVALLAPVAFDGLFEYPLALVLLALTMAIARRDELARWLRSAPKLALIVSAGLVIVIVVKIAMAQGSDETETLAIRRSFYGLYRVTETERSDGPVRDLISGNTRHGRQRVGDETPLSYYHPRGPLGDAFAVLPRPRSSGAVGLGVGAAAGHLRAGERMRFFEIDPVVTALARADFTYLAETPGEVEVVDGDARLTLEAERRAHSPRYDLLLIDAFAGDAIPTHLLTVEAMRLYLARLAPDGALLLHVSNRYYDLRPILAANARSLGLHGVHVARIDGLVRDQDPAQYVALAREAALLAPLVGRGWTRLEDTPAFAGAEPWTDDHVNVLAALASF